MATTIRNTMADIISDLRRKVFDYSLESLDGDIGIPGGTLRIETTFTDTALIPTTPATNSAKITIYDPSKTASVSSATMSAGSGTGVYNYDYAIATTAQKGIYGWVATATVSGDRMAERGEFEVKEIKRIWTDEELQRVLDRHRERHVRLLLTPDADYLVYQSGISNLESATLYNGVGQTASAIATSDYSADLNVGEFTFDSEYDDYDIYMDGISHNIFAAAEELLLELMADPSRAKQFSRGSISHTGYDLAELVREYRRKSGSGIRSTQIKRVYNG
jgi:hypothetical protein